MKNNYSIIILLSIILLPCCSDSFLERQPLDQLVTGNYYTTKDGIMRAIDACYTPLGEQPGYNGWDSWILGDGLSDDAQPNGIDPGYYLIDDFNVTSEQGEAATFWECMYRMVTLCNIALENIPRANITDDLRDILSGQARFLRAFAYFNLVRIYGDVPLIQKVLSADEANVKRQPVKDIYDAINEDLTMAIQELPSRTQYTGNDIGRVSKEAAKGLLAKVYLTQAGNWNYMADVEYGEQIKNPEMFKKSADLCLEIINSGIYGLIDNFADNFNLNNQNTAESIWQIQFCGCTSRHGGGNMLQAYFAPWGTQITNGDGWGTHSPTQDLFDAFYPGDKRLHETLFIPGDPHPEFQVPDPTDTKKTIPFTLQKGYGRSGYACRKYVVGRGQGICSMSAPNNTNIIRYADILLMRAECLNEIGNSPEAASLMDPIRSRAGLQPVSRSLTQDQLRDTILHERRVELALEQQRWYDLLRTGRAISVMSAQGKAITRDRLVFPIPNVEIQKNPNLMQNKGF